MRFRGGCLVQTELHNSEVARWGFLSRWSDFKPKLSRLILSCGEGYAVCGLRWSGASCLASEDPKEPKRYRGSYSYPPALNTYFLPCLEEPPPASSLNTPPAGARHGDSTGFPSRRRVLLPSLHALLPCVQTQNLFPIT